MAQCLLVPEGRLRRVDGRSRVTDTRYSRTSRHDKHALGAIAGDVIGSIYEGDNVKTPDFGPLFRRFSRPTDDTVLTCAVAEWVLRGAGDDLPDRLKSWFRQFPEAGYGGTFVEVGQLVHAVALQFVG